MNWLADQDKTIFLGQAVAAPGTAMSNTLIDVPSSKKIELPVFEETQLGMSLGLAIGGFVPISIFPRLNFFLCAINQLVNHVDKLPLMEPKINSKVIIRVGIGSVRPLDPQVQHKGDFTEAISKMVQNVNVVRLDEPEQIFPEYEKAFYSKASTLLIEVSDYLNEK